MTFVSHMETINAEPQAFGIKKVQIWRNLLDDLSMILTQGHVCDTYRKVSNIRRTLVGNKIVDHSDVVGALPVGAAPTTSSFST